MTENLSYIALADTMERHDLGIGPAELHGILTGMLCVDEGIDAEQWIHAALGDDADSLNDQDWTLFGGVCAQTKTSLADIELSFEPLLPDDDADIADRAQSLAEWCQGFLWGLGYENGDSQWPGDCNEVLQDLAEIAKLDVEAASDADENALVEIQEFVRAATQLVRLEFQNQPAPPRLH